MKKPDKIPAIVTRVHPLNKIHSKVPSNRHLAHETNIQQGKLSDLMRLSDIKHF